mmetsp:Transcript_25031/g.31314  ORF Transcript_25031/g.31314 Transcript_25031/m.31314 type:complete len:140 (+) Transcript_25031:26-445(+)
MQVDEERKGAAQPDLDIGGYEDDSEDEREIKEQEESAKDVLFKLGAAGAASAGATTMLVCCSVSSQCLAKIMYGGNWQEIGEATSTKTSTKGETAASDKGPKSILKLFALGGSTTLVALPDLDNLRSDAINQVVSQIFG